VAANDSYSTNQAVQLNIAAPGVLGNDTDVEGTALTAAIVAGAAHGTVTLQANGSFSYTPNASYLGPDSFTYRASDGTAQSATATVTITVTKVNHAPVANNKSVGGVGNATIPVTVSATDSDGDTLTYRVTANPAHGSVTGTGPNFVYTHTPGYHGPDSFSFVANDGTVDSAPAVVSITVWSATNHAPSAEDQWVYADEDTNAEFTLLAGDQDGDVLTYRIVTPPSHGTLHGTAPNLIYTPDPDFNGWDYFTFVASDGMYDSYEATMNFWIWEVNDPPVAQNVNVQSGSGGIPPSGTQGSGGTVVVHGQLVATDAEADWLYYDVVTQPAAGTLTIDHETGAFTYTKAPGGPTHVTFTYTAYDSVEQGNTATVDIVISSSP
jgi:VCBS repeat-containing protein